MKLCVVYLLVVILAFGLVQHSFAQNSFEIEDWQVTITASQSGCDFEIKESIIYSFNGTFASIQRKIAKDKNYFDDISHLNVTSPDITEFNATLITSDANYFIIRVNFNEVVDVQNVKFDIKYSVSNIMRNKDGGLNTFNWTAIPADKDNASYVENIDIFALLPFKPEKVEDIKPKPNAERIDVSNSSDVTTIIWHVDEPNTLSKNFSIEVEFPRPEKLWDLCEDYYNNSTAPPLWLTIAVVIIIVIVIFAIIVAIVIGVISQFRSAGKSGYNPTKSSPTQPTSNTNFNPAFEPVPSGQQGQQNPI